MAAKKAAEKTGPQIILDRPEVEHEARGDAPSRKLEAEGSGPDEKMREAAFDGEFFWNEQKLHGFSIDRYGIFVSHRVAMGAATLGRVLGDPDAFFPDALRILFLCSVEREPLLRLARNPEALEAAVYAWAAEAVPMARRYDAEGTALEIFNAVYANQHRPAPPAHGRAHGDDVGN
jgi:hypothetical protein